mgnify:CR=1 FL=1
MVGVPEVPNLIDGRAVPARGGAWLVDDSYNANPTSVHAGIAVLAGLPGRRWLVLGVSGQSINTLHTMAPQDDNTPGPAEAGANFSQLLSRLKRGP